MRFSVLLPERLAGCMRLRWLYGSYDFHIAICMTNAVQYKMDAINSLLKNAFIMKGSKRFYKSSEPLKSINLAKIIFCLGSLLTVCER